MTIMNRPFAGPDDLHAIIALIATRSPAHITDPPSIVDVHELLALPSIQATTQVWYDARGNLIGYAFLNPSHFLFFETRPTADADIIEAQMLAWGEAQVHRHTQARGEAVTLSTTCREDDAVRMRRLVEHGFQVQRWGAVELVRRLDAPIAAPHVPAGFQIRSVMGQDDVPALVALHRAAFGTEQMTVEYRQAMMQTPAYDPALDLIAVAPDGTFTAYCMCSISTEENRLTGRNDGYTDPVATHPAFQRRGLARALLLTGLQLLKQHGIDYARLSTSSENVPMQRVARAAGYQIAAKTLFFAKTLLSATPTP